MAVFSQEDHALHQERTTRVVYPILPKRWSSALVKWGILHENAWQFTETLPPSVFFEPLQTLLAQAWVAQGADPVRERDKRVKHLKEKGLEKELSLLQKPWAPRSNTIPTWSSKETPSPPPSNSKGASPPPSKEAPS